MGQGVNFLQRSRRQRAGFSHKCRREKKIMTVSFPMAGYLFVRCIYWANSKDVCHYHWSRVTM